MEVEVKTEFVPVIRIELTVCEAQCLLDAMRGSRGRMPKTILQDFKARLIGGISETFQNGSSDDESPQEGNGARHRATAARA